VHSALVSLKLYLGDCITTHRIQIAAVESNVSETAKDVPFGILDPKRFNTLRYRYVGRSDIGKAMADLSRTHGKFSIHSYPYIHRFGEWCRSPWPVDDSLLRIHHYTGSWESYSFRNDMRKRGVKNRQVWEDQAFTKREFRLFNDHHRLSNFATLTIVACFAA
jgi:hypothetical protein